MDEVKSSSIIHQKCDVAIQADNIDSLLPTSEIICEGVILLADR